MKRKTPWSQLDTFTAAYVTAFFFTEEPEERQQGGEFTDWHDTEGEWNRFPVADQRRIIQECIDFQEANAEALQDYPTTAAGHDFLYTRNHHGCGFWENDHGTKEQCDALTAAAHAAGERHLERWKGRNAHR
mgnify:FL=1